jgi:hypothetical protein
LADNVTLDASVGTFVPACDELTYSGDTAKVQVMRMVHVSGSEGSKTHSEVAGAAGTIAASAFSAHTLASTSGGYSNFHLVSAATTNATNIKASAGQIYAINVHNVAATVLYLKFHNTAGTPTAGASVVYTVAVQSDVPREIVFPHGLVFSTGIGITTVTGITDASAVAVGASELVIDVSYK